MRTRARVTEKTCPYCKENFMAKRSTKVYCTSRCRYQAFLDKEASPAEIVQLTHSVSIRSDTKTASTTLPATVSATLRSENNEIHRDERDLHVIDKKESPSYKPVVSMFVLRIGLKVDTEDIHFLQSPYSTWRIEPEGYCVEWVCERIYSLMEYTMGLGYRSHISGSTLSELAQGFEKLCNHANFVNLPDNYPYSEIILDWNNTLKKAASKINPKDHFRFILGEEKKIDAIAVTFILREAGYELISFNDLKF